MGGEGLEIIMLVSWNSPLESAAEVKGRRERSLQTGFGAEAALEEGSRGCSSVRMSQRDCLTQSWLVSVLF